LDGVQSPADLYAKLKKNGLDNDEAILDSFEGAAKFCTFAEPSGHKCGKSLGTPIRFILVGSQTVAVQGPTLGVSGPGAFFSGLAEGLLGDGKDIQACGADLGSVATAGGHLLEDLHNKNINGTVADIQNLLLAFQGSISDCKSAAGDLKPFLHILDGVHSPADLAQKIKHNILAGDESIIDSFEGAGKYCTFRAPNGHKCGKSLGRPLRIILLGPDALQLSVGGPGNFFAGFAEGLIGDAADVQHCGKDLSDVTAAGAHLIADLGKFNVTRTVKDIDQLVHAFSASASDCKAAVGDLQPFLHILDGVQSPADLYAKLKKNGLDNDEAILDSFEGAAKFCTFAEPNGHKCGKSLGTPIRFILVGSQILMV
jgi:hypothetical protein